MAADVLNTPPLVVTPGEPAGIGPDLVLAMAQQRRLVPWLVVGDPDALARRAAELGLDVSLDDDSATPATAAGRLTVAPMPFPAAVRTGVPDPENAAALLDGLRYAVDLCQSRRARALVTGPLQKSSIIEAGFAFSGHTEFLCDRAGVDDVVMLLVADRLRVALATTHLPLAAVPAAITRERLERRLAILERGLREQFGITAPRIAVTGLNPHAGEGGHLGREEIDVIEPVCSTMRDLGFRVRGPLPADTLFTPGLLQDVDAVFAMYHDQGLPVLKFHGFGRAVNVTLGLGFVRTSVDHGTALDIAGSGTADGGSMHAAMRLAEALSDRATPGRG